MPWSPVWNQPYRKASSVALGLLWYPEQTFFPLMTTSPTTPMGNRVPLSSMIAMSTLVPLPTVPGLCEPYLGSGFEVIWCAASVMAYASSTGALKVASRRSRTGAAREALQLRTKRRLTPSWSFSFSARERRIWWIVGTAVYHVAPCCLTSPQKTCALNLPLLGTITVPPDAKVERRADIRPCTWKSGITRYVLSFSQSS
mmetsp:Transcript_38112/g.100851  ORF Transcript_38112/g.100851 Transcript_38112/m.100851 type:complete len:200 (-) Transcript_38112:704-1303(-)